MELAWHVLVAPRNRHQGIIELRSHDLSSKSPTWQATHAPSNVQGADSMLSAMISLAALRESTSEFEFTCFTY